MHTININNNSTAGLHQNSIIKMTAARRVLFNALMDFQDERRRADQYFNVFDWLADNLKYIQRGVEVPYNQRTIRSWFEDNPNGNKIGIDDLTTICTLINNSSPIKAFHDEAMKLFEKNKDNIFDKIDSEKIKDQALDVFENVGRLSGDVKDAVSDNVVTDDEKTRLQTTLEKVDIALKKLKAAII